MSVPVRRTITLDDWPVPVTLRFEARRCRWLGVAALIWRDTLYVVTPQADTAAWVIAHELIHVWQYRAAGGWWSYLWRYARTLWQHGYLASGYEQQAMIHQSQVARGARCHLGPTGTLTASWLAAWDAPRMPRQAPSFGERDAWVGFGVRVDLTEAGRLGVLEESDEDPGTDVPFHHNNDHEADGS